MQKIQFAQNSRPPLLSLEVDPVTPSSIRNYMQPLETVVVTPDPFSTPSSLVKTPGPVTSLGSNLKRRLSFLDPPEYDLSFSRLHLSKLQNNYFVPKCLHALGYLLNCDITRDEVCSQEVDKFPNFFGKYKDDNTKKSIRRLKNEVRSLMSDHVLTSAAISAFQSETSKFSHDKLAGFKHDSICSICFRAYPNDEAINIHTDNFNSVKQYIIIFQQWPIG